MSVWPAGMLLVLTAAAPTEGRVKKLFESDHYTVTWGDVPTFPADAELVIGDGGGHGGTLGRVRFKPGKDGVDVLSVQLDLGRKPYRTKFPPDIAPITIQSARMTPAAYAELLRDLAVVASAKPARSGGDGSISTHDFWVAARLTAGKKPLLDLDWAGYWTSSSEYQSAKPTIAIKLVDAAIGKLTLKDHTLTAAERAWFSETFTRDWARHKGQSSYWWVCERSIMTVGVVGDATALPTLREVIREKEHERYVYYAINAVTRLTGTDVRDKPVEGMDLEATRRKVLDLLKDRK